MNREIFFQNVEDILLFSCILRALDWDPRYRRITLWVYPGKKGLILKPESETGHQIADDVFDAVSRLYRKRNPHPVTDCPKYQESKDFHTIMHKQGDLRRKKWKWCVTPWTFPLKPPQYLTAIPASSFEHFVSPPDFESLDGEIRGLVHHLIEEEGVITAYSCQGHFIPPGFPYVIFYSCPEKAYQIGRMASKVGWEVRGALFNLCPAAGPYIQWILAPSHFFRKSRFLKVFRIFQTRKSIPRLLKLMQNSTH